MSANLCNVIRLYYCTSSALPKSYLDVNVVRLLFIATHIYNSAFNWPTVPDIREDPAMQQLYTAMLVIYTTCESTLQKSYVWEKK